MEKIVAMGTIPHSGTHTMLNVFKIAGYLPRAGLWSDVGDEPGALLWAHLEEDRVIGRLQELAGKYPLILPIRHPWRMEASYRQRSMYDQLRPGGKLWRFYWALLQRLAPLGILIPVDAPSSRDRQLLLASIACGVTLQCRWERILNAGRNHKARTMALSELEPSCDEAKRYGEHHAIRELYKDEIK